MTRLRGWAPKGERLVDKVPQGKWKTATFLAARQQGVGRAEARRAALTLSASGGELSIVVAKGGSDVSATSAFVLPFIGALTVVTTVIAPFLIRHAWREPPSPSDPPV